MNKLTFVFILVVLLFSQLLSCGDKKEEQKTQQQIATEEEAQQEIMQDSLLEDILVEEETPDTFQIKETSYLPPAYSGIVNIDPSQVETKLSKPIQIDYINWDDSWKPERAELPTAIYWNFFDSSKVKHLDPEEINPTTTFNKFLY